VLALNYVYRIVIKCTPAIQHKVHLFIHQTLDPQHDTSDQPLLLKVNLKVQACVPNYIVVVVTQRIGISWRADLYVDWLGDHSGGCAMHRGEGRWVLWAASHVFFV
jgi:hypothetical protein